MTSSDSIDKTAGHRRNMNPFNSTPTVRFTMSTDDELDDSSTLRKNCKLLSPITSEHLGKFSKYDILS